MGEEVGVISQPLTGLAPGDTQVDEYYNDMLPEDGKVNRNPDTDNIGETITREKKLPDQAAGAGYVLNKLKALKANPYPGLRPFKVFETNVFFGRSEITFDLIARLATHRFLAVLGASGTGKSSLVRAGLLSGLRALPGRQGVWKIVICRPGKNPFGNLAVAVSKADLAPGCNETEIWKKLSGSSYGYEELYNSIEGPKDFNTLIVIDQFEELFRYRKDAGASGRSDASLFVKMLIDISRLKSLNTYVMITMRSEYLGDCVKFTDLAEVINEGQFLIPRMKFRQLRDAIIQPCSFSGASADRDFADKLIAEIGDNMDQLPVLQHALRRSYEIAKQKAPARGGIKILYEDYKETGLLENALDRHSNEIYSSLNDKQQTYCRMLFQSITDRSTDGRGIRRPLSFLTIFLICKESRQNSDPDNRIREDLISVLDSFRKENVNFLMPPPHVPVTEETEIDISHESLMRIWKRLKQWIEDEAKDAGKLKDLLKYGKNNYLTGSDLLIYGEWLKTKKPGFRWALLYKPADTTEADYRIQFNEAINLVERSRKNQRLKLFFLFLTTGVIFISLAIAFIMSFKNAQLKSNIVELSAARETQRLTNAQLSEANKNLGLRKDSLNIALAKRDTAIERYIRLGRILLKQKDSLSIQQLVLSRQRDSILLKNNKLELQTSIINMQKDSLNTANKFLKTAEDSLKIVSDSATNLKNLALAIRQSEKSISIPFNDEKREGIKAYLALLAYQLYLESSPEKDRRLQARVYTALYSALKKSVSKDPGSKDVWQVTAYKSTSDHLTFAAMANNAGNQSNNIYITAENKKLYSFNPVTNKKDSSIILTGNKLTGIEAGSSGWIAVITLSEKLLLKNVNNPLQDTIYNFKSIVRTCKFSLDGSKLFVYTKDGMLNTIDIKSKKVLSQDIKISIEEIAVSNKHVYGLTTNGSVIIWNNTDPAFRAPVTILNPLQEESVYGTAIACTPNDSLVVWGNEKGQVFYFKNELQKKPQYLTKFSWPVTSIAFNNAFDLLAIASYDKTIQVFNLPNLQSDVPLVLTNNEGPVTSVFFQKEKSGKEKLISVINPGIVRIYPMDLETMACSLNRFYENKQPSTEDKIIYIDKQAMDNKITIKCN